MVIAFLQQTAFTLTSFFLQAAVNLKFKLADESMSERLTQSSLRIPQSICKKKTQTFQKRKDEIKEFHFSNYCPVLFVLTDLGPGISVFGGVLNFR